MRSLILLTALWLVVQYGAMALGAVSHRSSPSQGVHPTEVRLDALLGEWPDASRRVADGMIQRYGAPDLAADSFLRWDRPDGTSIVAARPAWRRSQGSHDRIRRRSPDDADVCSDGGSIALSGGTRRMYKGRSSHRLFYM
jgi:hypothetical protein